MCRTRYTRRASGETSPIRDETFLHHRGYLGHFAKQKNSEKNPMTSWPPIHYFLKVSANSFVKIIIATNGLRSPSVPPVEKSSSHFLDLKNKESDLSVYLQQNQGHEKSNVCFSDKNRQFYMAGHNEKKSTSP